MRWLNLKLGTTAKRGKRLRGMKGVICKVCRVQADCIEKAGAQIKKALT